MTGPTPHNATLPERRTELETRRPKLWNVVILDDEDHTYDYVIEILTSLFGHSDEKAFAIAEAIDVEGRAIAGTFHREFAELRREQVLSFGADHRIAMSAGPMSVVLEPAEDSGDDEDA